LTGRRWTEGALRATPGDVVLSKEAEERRDADQIINRDEKKKGSG
jgi:hypothetical protein